MKFLWSAMLASALFIGVPASAQGGQFESAKHWLEVMDSDTPEKHFAKIKMQGTLNGFTVMNAALHGNEKEQLFCAPDMVLTIDQAKSILESELERRPELVEYPAAMVMLFALERVFACE